MASSWYLIDTWSMGWEGCDHVLFRKFDEEYLSTIKELIAKVGVGAYEWFWERGVGSDRRMLRLVYLRPADLRALMDVFHVTDCAHFNVRLGSGVTVSEIDKIRCVIACSHCIGDEFWVEKIDINGNKYTVQECDHQSI